MMLVPTEGLVFVIGMRRSGTSMIRRFINEFGYNLLFEPHDIWWAVGTSGMARMQKSEAWQAAHRSIRQCFATSYSGAKFALNPGVDAFQWRLLEHRFNKPRFVFVRRNQQDTYASYSKVDKDAVRGVAPEEIHSYYWHALYEDFERFARNHPRRAVLIDYDQVLETQGEALEPMWSLLDVEVPEGWAAHQLRRPDHNSGRSAQ